MTSAELTPLQLAPTVGPAAALAGVLFQTGSMDVTGKRVLSGLIHRVGTQNALLDNAGCFGDISHVQSDFYKVDTNQYIWLN